MTPVQGQPSPMRYKQTIRKLEKYLQDAFAELGAKTYESAWKGELEAPAFVPLVQKIENIIEAIDTNKQELEELQTARKVARGARCPYCGWTAPAGIRTCLSCGRDMYPGASAQVQTVSAPPGQVPTGSAPSMPGNTTLCLQCGRELPIGSVFCGFCGWRVEEQVAGEPTPTPVQVQVPEAEPETQGIGKCPHCGDPLSPESSVCFNCGKQLQPTADVVRSYEVEENNLASFKVICPNCRWTGIDAQINRDGTSEDGLCPQCGSEAWDYV